MSDAHIRTHRLPLGLGLDPTNLIMLGANTIYKSFLPTAGLQLGKVPCSLAWDESAITSYIEALCTSKDMKTCWLSGFCGEKPELDADGRPLRPHVCLQGAVEFDLSAPNGIKRLQELMARRRTAHCKWLAENCDSRQYCLLILS